MSLSARESFHQGDTGICSGKNLTLLSSPSVNGSPYQFGELQKLKVCYNILNNLSIISPSLFTFHPSCTLPYHSRILFMSVTRTNSHRFSFFVDTIPYWKSLPSSIVGLLLKKVNFHKNSYNLCGAQGFITVM